MHLPRGLFSSCLHSSKHEGFSHARRQFSFVKGGRGFGKYERRVEALDFRFSRAALSNFDPKRTLTLSVFGPCPLLPLSSFGPLPGFSPPFHHGPFPFPFPGFKTLRLRGPLPLFFFGPLPGVCPPFHHGPLALCFFGPLPGFCPPFHHGPCPLPFPGTNTLR